jgi:lysophospholipid acyltransferase (LPLAT)-like uncharacterized protein
MNKETTTKTVLYTVPRLTVLLLTFLSRTSLYLVRHQQYYQQVTETGKGFIIICWHGKMLFPIYLHRNRGICAMVSEHTDGEMISRTIQRLGYTTVRGSSTRGGVKAFVQLLARVKKGIPGCILPDGPRGPRHYLKPGVIVLASRSQRPLLPMTYAAAKPLVLKSWDRFTLWRPFSKLCMLYGEPIHVPAHLDEAGIEIWRQAAQECMDALEKEADEFFRK